MIKKEKIFELKIEEDDDISGIDSISLVDQPAIEVNWVAFSKHKDMVNPCESGYVAYGTKMKDGKEVPNCVPIHKQKMEDSHSDYPETIKHNAQRVLDYVEKNGWGSCGTEVGKQCANQLAKGEPLSKDTIKRMYSYLSRHKVDLESSKGYGDGCGKLMYDAWGGASALSWAQSKIKEFEKEEMSGKVYPTTINGTNVFEHGQDENNVNGKEGGVKDSNLTENGVKYAKNVGKHIAETGTKRIISSGIKRAKDTAKIIKDTANEGKTPENRLVHYINNHLNTWNVGKFDGDDIDQFDEQYFVNNPDKEVPGGVSFNTFVDQMVKCYHYVKDLPETDSVVTHSKVIRALNALHITKGTWNDEAKNHFLHAKKKDKGDYNFGGQKVSIDYDGTLSTTKGMLLAKQLLNEGYDVHIVTSRNSSESTPVNAAADELGIPHDKIHYTNGQPKWKTLEKLGIHKHIDNNPDVINDIKKHLPGVVTEEFDYNVGSIGGYVDPGIGKKKKKVLEKGLTKPSMFEDEINHLFTTQLTEQYFAQDIDKQIVLGPAMIPNEKIFRKDNQGNPYYVYFSPETIKMIADKYMKNKYIDNNDLMHDGKAVPDVFVIESWIKESNNDKSTDYGFEHLPSGTWFVSMKINNPEVWKMVKNHELNGFSVSGFFEEVAEFKREELFLIEVAKILKDVRD